MNTAPDFFHTLTGWRKFDTANGGKLLTSAGHVDHAWPVSDLGEAYCRSGWAESHGSQHDAPQLNCTCGFYCYKERADAEQHAQGRLLAKVEIWGRLAEHARGYRAQHMKILELYVPPNFPEIVALTKRYGVAVFIDEGAETWTSENPYASSLPNPWPSQPAFIPNQTPQLQIQPPPNSPYLNLLGNVGMQPAIGHALQALANYQNQIAQQQYQNAYAAMQQQYNYAPSLLQLVALAPKAPIVMADFEWEEIEADESPEPVVTDAIFAESEMEFDPVADRVNARLAARVAKEPTP